MVVAGSKRALTAPEPCHPVPTSCLPQGEEHNKTVRQLVPDIKRMVTSSGTGSGVQNKLHVTVPPPRSLAAPIASLALTESITPSRLAQQVAPPSPPQLPIPLPHPPQQRQQQHAVLQPAKASRQPFQQLTGNVGQHIAELSMFQERGKQLQQQQLSSPAPTSTQQQQEYRFPRAGEPASDRQVVLPDSYSSAASYLSAMSAAMTEEGGCDPTIEWRLIQCTYTR